MEVTMDSCTAKTYRYLCYSWSLYHIVSEEDYAPWLTTKSLLDTLASPECMPLYGKLTIRCKWHLISPVLSKTSCIVQNIGLVCTSYPLKLFLAFEPRESVPINILEPLPKSRCGFQYIIVIVDWVKKWFMWCFWDPFVQWMGLKHFWKTWFTSMDHNGHNSQRMENFSNLRLPVCMSVSRERLYVHLYIPPTIRCAGRSIEPDHDSYALFLCYWSAVGLECEWFYTHICLQKLGMSFYKYSSIWFVARLKALGLSILIYSVYRKNAYSCWTTGRIPSYTTTLTGSCSCSLTAH